MAGRILVFVFAAVFAFGDALDDSVNLWAKKLSSHLGVDEIAHVTWNSPRALDAGSTVYQTRAKALLARALQRRLRNPKTVEITATLSQNLTGYLFIAEIHRENESIVEIATVPPPVALAEIPVGLRLDRRLLWEQEEPMLDVTTTGDQMMVLDAVGVTRYEQRDSKWAKAESEALDIPAVRDLRGRLTVIENTLTVEFPGFSCRGSWRPVLAVECQTGGPFVAGRNTMQETGWPPYFAHAEIGGDHVILAADGRTYVYDSARKQLASADLGGDFAVTSSACTSAKLLASDAATDSLAIFDLVNHVPVRVSDSTQMSGPITAMWPARNAALAITRNKNTNRYEAYSISVACGR